MQDTVTALVPFHRVDQMLLECITSLREEEQSLVEILLVSDGVSDENLRELESFLPEKARLVKNQGQGLVDALNTGLREARGKYIMRLDSDDICISGRTNAQLSRFLKNPDLAVCGSQIIRFCQHGYSLGVSRYRARWHRGKMLRPLTCQIAHPSSMFKSTDALKLGGYSALYPHAEDFDLWLRMLELGEIENLSQPFVYYREHSSQVSRVHHKTQHLSTLRALYDDSRRFGPDSRQSHFSIGLRGSLRRALISMRYSKLSLLLIGMYWSARNLGKKSVAQSINQGLQPLAHDGVPRISHKLCPVCN